MRVYRPQALGAPLAVDWRDHGGDWVTPVRDQGNCGSCVAHGTLASIESRARIACGDVALDLDLSEAALFFCGCGKCCASGWNFEPALEHCRVTGVVREADLPYTDVDRDCPAGLSPWFKISGWSSQLSVDDRKAQIVKGPVVGGLAVYDDFYYYSSGVYAKTPSAKFEGYHAVCVVGYDDAARCWICKNSWGAGWGTSGFFRIKYGEAEMDTSFAFYAPEVPCPPADGCARYAEYLDRVLARAASNASLRRALRYYVCGRGSRPYSLSASVRAVVLDVRAVLKACPAYRASFCARLG
jgi:C1A family cysteine protease